MQGTKTLTPEPANQGSLELSNGAVLEYAQVAIRNYSLETVTPIQGGGIILARNATIRNCWRAADIMDYPDFPYGSACTFSNVSFTIDDASVFSGQTNAGYLITLNNVRGVNVKNCTFKNTVSENVIGYAQRNGAIYALDAGMRVNTCSFEGFRQGVITGSGLGAPTRTVKVLSSYFNKNSESMVFTGAYDIAKANKVENVKLYEKLAIVNGTPVYTLFGAGIFIDGARGATISAGNKLYNYTAGSPDPYYPHWGIIASNTKLMGTQIIDNELLFFDYDIQVQKSNHNLDIACNQIIGNEGEIALYVNPQPTSNPLNPNYPFKNQGTGCDPAIDIRAGNRFLYPDPAWESIRSKWAVPWRYYAWGNTYPVYNEKLEVPLFYTGNFNMTTCNPPVNIADPNSQCGKTTLAEPLSEWLRDEALVQWNQQAQEQQHVQVLSLRAQLLWGDIIRAFEEQYDRPGLLAFLEANTWYHNALRLLVPLYTEQGDMGAVARTIALLPLSPAEQKAWNDYYSLWRRLLLEGRSITALDATEINTLHTVAAGDYEISPLALAVLEYGQGEEWLHIPERSDGYTPQRARATVAVSPEVSVLLPAAPNPAVDRVILTALVSAGDAALQPALVIRDLSGREQYRKALQEGDNRLEVHTAGWQPGLYIYSLLRGNKVLQSAKLSVLH